MDRNEIKLLLAQARLRAEVIRAQKEWVEAQRRKLWELADRLTATVGAAPAASAPARGPSADADAGAAVLLVDPCDHSRGALAELLRVSGCSVLETRDGAGALHAARGRPPALVIVDAWPFARGLAEVVERLRGDAATARVPVLAVTAAPAAEYRERVLAAGCAAYLEKPCPPEVVLAEIRRVLAAAAPPAPRPAAGAPAATLEQGLLDREVHASEREMERERQQTETEREADRRWLHEEVSRMRGSGWSWDELAEIGFGPELLAGLGIQPSGTAGAVGLASVEIVPRESRVVDGTAATETDRAP